MKLFNRHFPVGERIEYMGWVHEGVVAGAACWQTYRPRFLVLKGTDVMLFEHPPVSIILNRPPLFAQSHVMKTSRNVNDGGLDESRGA